MGARNTPAIRRNNIPLPSPATARSRATRSPAMVSPARRPPKATRPTRPCPPTIGPRALYLGKSLYRIHGTNQPSTIGTYVSSGCIRLVNADIEDLYGRVQVGTRVVVLTGGKPATNGMR